jgi:signal peptidase I
MIPTRYTANELIRSDFPPSGVLRLHVVSDSMLPWLHVGDVLVVRRIDPDSLRCGDIIVVWRSNQLVTHRLLLVDERGWWTKGDRLIRLDEPAGRNDIVGQVIAIERPGSKLDFTNVFWRTISRLVGYYHWVKVKFIPRKRR